MPHAFARSLARPGHHVHHRTGGPWPHPADGLAQLEPFRVESHRTDVRAAADAMVSSGMRAVGYVYINIDDTRRGKRGPDSAPLLVATPWLARA